MYQANTVEQFKIRNWLENNFDVPHLRQVELLSRNTVRITDREGAMAIVYCDKVGVVHLESIDETA